MDVKSKRSITSYFLLALKIFKIVPSARYMACDVIGTVFWISFMLAMQIFSGFDIYKNLLFNGCSNVSIAECVNNTSNMFVQPAGDALEIIAVAYLAFMFKPLIRK